MSAVLKKSTPGKFAYICHFQQIGINATKIEKTGIHFKTDVFAAVAVVDAKAPYLKKSDPTAKSGNYIIDPDGEGCQEGFSVYCDITDKNGVDVTVISHHRESRKHVTGYERPGSYSRAILYRGGVSLS